jgi:hypothetical protein
MSEAGSNAAWSSLLADPPERGTEGGVIVLDDAHDLGARITFEQFDGGGGAITCGIYEWMMHTRFFDIEASARRAFEAMKVDMDAILWRIPLKGDPDFDNKMRASGDELSAFVDKYP